ncbi:MAG: phenylacetate-CoA ligase [Clostridiales bacterium]|nr:phenylacetate-CoA ligase [Clostridiales bacterium]MDK2992015.1 phenylacetate-CoA ligase [Clostridiales bacterium]
MIWSPKEECMPRGSMETLQLDRLKRIVQYAYDRVPFYKKAFDDIGLKPSDIRTLKDVSRLPFTTKGDLRDNYPYGMFAVPMKQIVRLHGSSGTTGKPTVVGYTRNDIDTWAELVARVAAEAGATDDDVAQIAFGYGLFTGAFGLHYGLERLGAAVIPMSSGNTERQIALMQDFSTTVLVGTPSYALYMAEVARNMGVDTEKLPLRLGLFGAEGSTEAMREELQKRWHIVATENYGLSEIMGPGVAGECEYREGMHIAEDHFLVEIIDPVTEQPVDYGNVGELVITTLTKEGVPLIRYRTHDITSIIADKCACGRTLYRIAKIKGRTDDMLIIKGVNVFPSQIETVLMNIEEVGPHYEIIVRKKGFMDELEINIEVVDAKLLEHFSELEALERKIKHHLKSNLLIDAKVNLVEPQTLKRFEGKARRVIDLRGGQS